MGVKWDFVPENLKQCEEHYVPVSPAYISCNQFGQDDGMDGKCWWCKEMTPYQWHMCLDETFLRSLLNPMHQRHYQTRQEAAEFIEERKQNHVDQEKNIPTSLKM